MPTPPAPPAHAAGQVLVFFPLGVMRLLGTSKSPACARIRRRLEYRGKRPESSCAQYGVIPVHTATEAVPWIRYMYVLQYSCPVVQ